MKKSCLLIISAAVLALVMLLPVGAFATTSATEQHIGEAKAKAAALANAGISEAEATFLKARLDHDDGRVIYDVEFYGVNTGYDYEIDAVSGSILEYDRDTENRASRNNSGQSSQSVATDTGRYIGEAKAKSIALANAGLSESEVSRMKVKLDRDDGRTVYEVDFRDGRMEYEYDIDAVSGAILESDAEYDD